MASRERPWPDYGPSAFTRAQGGGPPARPGRPRSGKLLRRAHHAARRPPPPGLDPAQIARLRELEEATIRAQRAEGAAAAERALSLVPRPLRAAVRKVAGA